jgi:hypothetical protein
MLSVLIPTWDSWELDSNFFKAMTRWTIDHPETTLHHVLDNMCVGIGNGKDLLELIPDSPFPARSLIKAIGYLVKLGTVGALVDFHVSLLMGIVQTVSRANAEVERFAKDIIQWVSDMQSAFSSGRNGHISWRTKRNLRKMRYAWIFQCINESWIERRY